MAHRTVVVVGSGIGGLAAAVALARAGLRVTVFEQHSLPGGWAHSFTLEGFSFSPGVHYIGELGPGGGFRAMLEGLGLGEHLTFYRQNPDGYEHGLLGGHRFDWPAGRDAAVARLGERFPRERDGIVRYFDLIARMYAELGRVPEEYGRNSVPVLVPTLLRYGWMRFDRFLDRFTTDPLLRAILTMQAGDHNEPPTRCPAAVHTAVTSHYLDGGYYPHGGGRALPKAFVKELRRHGGQIHVNSPVDEVLVRDGRAVGVRLRDGTEVSADLVVSNADPGVTWGRLVRPEHVPWRMARRLARTEWSPGAMSLFLGVDADVRALGLDSGNLWYSRTLDVGAIYEYAHTGAIDPPPELPGLYIGCSTLKDPAARRDGRHALEVFSFVPTAAFERWADSTLGQRPADYLAFKAAYERRMLDALDVAVPGLRSRIVFRALGTPLSNRHYVAATRGAVYGTSRVVRNVGPFGFPVKTPLPGLFMCGASTICHGVYGATMSGIVTAQLALGCERADLYEASPRPITVLPAEPAPTPVRTTA